MKVEQSEAPAVAVLKVEPASPGKVIKLSDGDEPEGPILSGAAVHVASSSTGPSAPCVAGLPDTSGDEEFVRKLFVELNCEAIGIPGDGSLVILDSDEEGNDNEKEDAVGNGASSSDGEAAPKPSPSA